MRGHIRKWDLTKMLPNIFCVFRRPSFIVSVVTHVALDFYTHGQKPRFLHCLQDEYVQHSVEHISSWLHRVAVDPSRLNRWWSISPNCLCQWTFHAAKLVLNNSVTFRLRTFLIVGVKRITPFLNLNRTLNSLIPFLRLKAFLTFLMLAIVIQI